MDEDEKISDVIEKTCKCGGVLKGVKTKDGFKVKVVCDKCSIKAVEHNHE